MSTRWKRTRPLALAKIKRTVVSCFRVLHHHAACLYVSITPNNVGIRSEIFDFCLPSVAATSAFFIFMRYENLPAVGTKFRVIPRLKISDEKFSGGRKKRKKKRGLTWIQWQRRSVQIGFWPCSRQRGWKMRGWTLISGTWHISGWRSRSKFQARAVHASGLSQLWAHGQLRTAVLLVLRPKRNLLKRKKMCTL